MFAEPGPRFHGAHFYRDDDALCALVTDFIVDGLLADQSAVLVATAGHLSRITAALVERSLEVARFEAENRLLLRDARDMLTRIMTNGMPDEVRMRTTIIPLIDQVSAGRPVPTVRAYGDMVNVLWDDGKTDAAYMLEELWNELTEDHHVAVLCGYSMGGLFKRAADRENILKFHTHLVSEDGDMSLVHQ